MFPWVKRREPEKYLANIDLFPAAWNQPGPAIALIAPDGIDKLRNKGLAFTVIHQDPRRVVILKREAP
ncbi:MAG: hypothetical protein HC782_00815 [Gammaproteobacteria bacterium]|nr:hypothetical protein [Gammaproteobacteria bacterium]